jgi:type VI secretion system secreted protein VgrG
MVLWLSYTLQGFTLSNPRPCAQDPTLVPTTAPTNFPSLFPTHTPSAFPTRRPTLVCTLERRRVLIERPEGEAGSALVSFQVPSLQPSLYPTFGPSLHPSLTPSERPSLFPTTTPSLLPTLDPTTVPSVYPTARPSLYPSGLPTFTPSRVSEQDGILGYTSGFGSLWCTRACRQEGPLEAQPCLVFFTTLAPARSRVVARVHSVFGTWPLKAHTCSHGGGGLLLTLVPVMQAPTTRPTTVPTLVPTTLPSRVPSGRPTTTPRWTHQLQPDAHHTFVLSPCSVSSFWRGSRRPTTTPSIFPTRVPTAIPSRFPTALPTRRPSRVPTQSPSRFPSRYPTQRP